MLFTFRSLVSAYTARRVQIFVDNQSMLPVIQVGLRTNVALINIAKKVFTMCAAICISLAVVWVLRDENTDASDISKGEYHDDWQLMSSFFLFH
jgi:hypothetical protein